MLFSATQTRKTEDLARLSLKKEPLYVGVHDERENATVEGLKQVRQPWRLQPVSKNESASLLSCMFLGLCGVSIRASFLAAIHILEEEQE